MARNRTTFGPGHPYRFKPGQSGNPGGRPRSKRLSDAYRVLLETDDPRKQKTLAELIAGQIVKQALKGDLPCAKEVADRTEGKPPQILEHAGLDRIPTAFNVFLGPVADPADGGDDKRG